MVRAECYYHVVWATHRRQALIDTAAERIIFQSIRERALKLESRVMAVNGMPDHIHVVAQIPPTIALSEWIRQVKGVSSRDLNRANGHASHRFAWQSGYGVFTVGLRGLPDVIRYVENQKSHHSAQTTVAVLEEFGDD